MSYNFCAVRSSAACVPAACWLGMAVSHRPPCRLLTPLRPHTNPHLTSCDACLMQTRQTQAQGGRQQPGFLPVA